MGRCSARSLILRVSIVRASRFMVQRKVLSGHSSRTNLLWFTLRKIRSLKSRNKSDVQTSPIFYPLKLRHLPPEESLVVRLARSISHSLRAQDMEAHIRTSCMSLFPHYANSGVRFLMLMSQRTGPAQVFSLTNLRWREASQSGYRISPSNQQHRSAPFKWRNSPKKSLIKPRDTSFFFYDGSRLNDVFSS